MSQIKIDRYINLLKEYNETTNIYSRKAYDKLDFHVQDSKMLASLIKDTPKTVLDIGSGSGFPSVIIAICNPQNKVLAVESKSRKTRFLEWVQQELDLQNYTVFNDDINQWLSQKRYTVDTMTAKAFGPYDKILKIYAKLSTPKTNLYIPISESQFSAFKLLPHLKNSVIETGGFYYLKK